MSGYRQRALSSSSKASAPTSNPYASVVPAPNPYLAMAPGVQAPSPQSATPTLDTLSGEHGYDPLLIEEDSVEVSPYEPLYVPEEARAEGGEYTDATAYEPLYAPGGGGGEYGGVYVDDLEEAEVEGPGTDVRGRALDPVKQGFIPGWTGEERFRSKALAGYDGERTNSDFMRAPASSRDRALDRMTGMIGEGRHVVGTHTHYMDTEEQEAHRLSFDKGKAFRGGERASTMGASGIGTWGEKGANRNIYAMRPDGTFHAAGAWDEHREVEAGAFREATGGIGAAPDGKADSTAVNLGFLNHSSLVAGGKVAGAGEMMIEDGEVRLINDRSGHYKPDNEMLMNSVWSLGAQGVDLDNLAVEFGNKKSHRQGRKHGDLVVRAAEVWAERFEGKDLERRLRAKRYHRKGLFAELLEKTTRTDEHAGSFSDKRHRFETGTAKGASKDAPTREKTGIKSGNTKSLMRRFDPVARAEDEAAARAAREAEAEAAPAVVEPEYETTEGYTTLDLTEDENLYDSLDDVDFDDLDFDDLDLDSDDLDLDEEDLFAALEESPEEALELGEYSVWDGNYDSLDLS